MLPALRRAKSLLAFHIGANPGITKRVSEYYMRKLRIAAKDKPLQIQVAKERNGYRFALKDPKADLFFSPQMFDWLEKLGKKLQSQHAEETHQLNMVNQDLQVNRLSEVTVVSSGADMSIYRVLGCKIDVPGSGQWRMQNSSDEQNCWCCNGSIYSIIFWTK